MSDCKRVRGSEAGIITYLLSHNKATICDIILGYINNPPRATMVYSPVLDVPQPVVS